MTFVLVMQGLRLCKSTTVGNRIASAFFILCRFLSGQVGFQRLPIRIGYRAVGSFRHSIGFLKGDTPIEE